MLNFCRRRPLGAIGAAIIVIMALAALLAGAIAPFDPLTADYGAMLQAPLEHVEAERAPLADDLERLGDRVREGPAARSARQAIPLIGCQPRRARPAMRRARALDLVHTVAHFCRVGVCCPQARQV